MEQENIPQHPRGSGFGGKYVRLPEGYRERLSKPLPEDALKKHPTKTFLTSIKAMYVVERLNDVFGPCGWDFEHDIVGNTTTHSGGKDVPFVLVHGRIYMREFDLYTPIQYGGHETDTKNVDPSDGYKSAVTDALSKCASTLEIGIQVYKGNPYSKQANKTTRKAQASMADKAKPEPAPEPVVEVTEKEAIQPTTGDENFDGMKSKTALELEERKDLINRHKKLFGKAPSSRISTDNLRTKVEDGENIEEELLEEEAESIPVDEMPSNAEEVAAPVDADAAEKKSISLDKSSEEVYEDAMKKINSYTNHTALGEAAGDIVFMAELNTDDPELIEKIKQSVNVKWKALKNG